MRQTVVRELRKRRLDPVSIENGVGAGVPDLNYILGWIELKQVKAWPKRPSTPLRLDHFTSGQRRWISRRHRAGGLVFVLLKVGKEWLLFDGETAAEHLGRTNRSELYGLAKKAWPKRINWNQLAEAISVANRKRLLFGGCFKR